jgi:hypothetical protein
MKKSKMNKKAALEKRANEVIYHGLFTDSETKEMLKEWFPPKFENVYLDHITVAVKPEKLNYSIGSLVEAKIASIVEDENAQALIFDNVKSEQTPHMVISTRQGISPLYCKELVKKASKITKLAMPLKMRLKAGVFTKAGEVITEKSTLYDN